MVLVSLTPTRFPRIISLMSMTKKFQPKHKLKLSHRWDSNVFLLYFLNRIIITSVNQPFKFFNTKKREQENEGVHDNLQKTHICFMINHFDWFVLIQNHTFYSASVRLIGFINRERIKIIDSHNLVLLNLPGRLYWTFALRLNRVEIFHNSTQSHFIRNIFIPVYLVATVVFDSNLIKSKVDERETEYVGAF